MTAKPTTKKTAAAAKPAVVKTAFYECVFIARQDLAKSDVDKLTDGFAELLQKNGAKIMKREYWGLRPLAYEVAKNRRGHYVMLCVEANLASLTPFITELQHSEEIIRNMEVRVEKIESKPSVMLQRSDDSEAA